MRVDKAKNIKALKDELLKNPLQTEDELAKKLGVDRKTINRLKEEMPEIVKNLKSDEITKITDDDREIIEISQFITLNQLRKVKEGLEQNKLDGFGIHEVKKVSEIAKESTARYTLFRGKATDENGGTNEIFSILNEIQGLKENN